jgi:outer membrane protein assembly factor BamB
VWVLPGALAVLALTTLAIWLFPARGNVLVMRVPGTDGAPSSQLTATNPVLLGHLSRADGVPAARLEGAWPAFRGPARNGISQEMAPLSRAWLSSEPRQLWSIDVGEGYAGAAVLNGRVYLMDYDREKKQDALRCLSLDDGREIWRYAYPVPVKRNHGMSRTVPAVTKDLVVAMGPKCHVVCLDAVSGELRWGLDLVRQYGATVPPWYSGQCPLIDKGAVILAPCGKDALLLSLDGQTGKVLWQTPNPHGWKMTHSSIMPMALNGESTYVYCANEGVVSVSAGDGSIRWQTTDWKISLATVPSPLVLEGNRLFLTGGYNAGSLMLQITNTGGHYVAQTLFKLPAAVFGATQHTPLLVGDHIYGVRADGKFVCLTLDGKVVWTSSSAPQFGLGSFIMADGLIYALNDSGLLRMVEVNPEKFNLLAQAQVLEGHESWGPMALAGNRLIARDLTRMVCLDVGKH